MKVCIGAVAAFAVLGAASAAQAQVVFGNFEGNQSDGFGSWGAGVVPFASDTTGTTYAYSSTGATNGSAALDVITPNTGSIQQDLAYDFVTNGTASEFLNNDVLSFDVSAEPASVTGATAGYQHVYEVALNAPGAGFVAQTADPVTTQYYYGGFGGSTQTVSINYDAFKSNITGSSYIQLVIETQTGGGAPGDMYFDNFRLSSVPEPGSIGLLAVGAMGLLRRRRMVK